MNLDRYECTAGPQFKRFSFQSIGPNGTIMKVVDYIEIPGIYLPDGRPVVNLRLGDWDEQKQHVDDLIVSNNRDREKVLATVASTIISFTEKHGKIPVFAEGSSPAKTRLYQMGINAHLEAIESLFWVYGRIGEDWQSFKPGINFNAFLVIKK
jgi:hypothetical protein